MDCLKSICEQHLCDSITTESVSSLLLLADMYNSNELKVKCIEHITSYPKQVMTTEGWKALASTRPEVGLGVFQIIA